MTTPPKPKKVVAPEGCCKYLESGKEYEVIGFWQKYRSSIGFSFYIEKQPGKRIRCTEKICSHLNFKNWIVTEYEEQQ